MGNHFVYIVRCSDNSSYIGYTNNIEVCINKHDAGKGTRYTETRRPVVLVYQEMYEIRLEALCREYEIKTFTK